MHSHLRPNGLLIPRVLNTCLPTHRPLPSLAIAACLTPTDPIIIHAVVKGSAAMFVKFFGQLLPGSLMRTHCLLLSQSNNASLLQEHLLNTFCRVDSVTYLALNLV